MILIVDHTELTWGYTMYFVLGMDDALVFACPFQCGWMILWSVADLECHICGLHFLGQEVEVLNREVGLVGSLWVVAMRHI